MGNVLLLMIFLPLAAAVLAIAIGWRYAATVRWISLAATVATLVLALVIVANYRPQNDFADQPAAALTDKGPIQPNPDFEVKKAWNVPSMSSGVPRVQFHLGLDGISLWLVVLTALLMVSSVLVSWEAITDRVVEYYALMLLLETALLGVFCAFDLILFYIFFEFTLIPLFFLIGIWGGPQKRYAARKFFIYTLGGSVISLVGLVAFVVMTHQRENQTLTFSIPELARAVAQGSWLEPQVQIWIFLALFLGFAIKVPLVPFHTWLPLAHVEAPTAGSVILAGVLLKLGSYGFLRLCLPLLPYASWNLGVPLIGTLAVIGIIYGALCAVAQEDIKKLVAYSSVSHLGFCMLGMFALNAEGVSGSLVQMVNHGLSTGALFLLVGMIYERYHTRQLSDFGGLAARLPLLAFFTVFICLSSAGLPALNGFVGEFLSLIGMFKVHWGYAALGATGVVLGAWYLLTLLQRAFFGPVKEPHSGGAPVRDLKLRELAALVPIAVVCVFIGVYPKPMLEVIEPDVNAVLKVYQDPEKLKPREAGSQVAVEER